MTSEREPRFTLPVGEGEGALLGLAAGDTAGGRWAGGYSAVTQQATVLAYHLLRHDGVERLALATELAELGGLNGDPPVYRRESAHLTAWLASAQEGEPTATSEPSIEPAGRVAPVGLWYRRDPDALVRATIATARLTHNDAPSVVAAVAVAGAVAAAGFAQNGRDMMMGVVDIAERAAGAIAEEPYRYGRAEGVAGFVEVLARLGRQVGSDPASLAAEAGSGPVARVALAVALAAPADSAPHTAIAAAVELGGSALGALVGGIVGARVGVRPWPWEIPNASWFVAIGRRLVSGGEEEGEPLPVPYAVEELLTHGRAERRQ